MAVAQKLIAGRGIERNGFGQLPLYSKLVAHVVPPFHVHNCEEVAQKLTLFVLKNQQGGGGAC